MRVPASAYVALVLVLSALSPPARAAPIAVTLTIAPSSMLTLRATTLGSITASAAIGLSGTQVIEIDPGLPPASEIRLAGGNLYLSDASLTLKLGALGMIHAGWVDLQAPGYFQALAMPATSQGGDDYAFNPMAIGASSLVVNSGLLTYQGTGSAGALVGSGTLDFSWVDVDFDLPDIGAIAVVSRTLLDSTAHARTYQISLALPFSASSCVMTDPIGIEVAMEGSLFATGTYVVNNPEPGTLLLALIAAGGLWPVVRSVRGQARR